MLQVGSDVLVDELRALTSIELFVNSKFYSIHPVFLSVFELQRNLFSSVESALKFSVSKEALDSDLSSEDLIKKEAIIMCSAGKWSSFVCVLALSSVLKKCVELLYPDIGLEKFKVLFNRVIYPRRIPVNKHESLPILFFDACRSANKIDLYQVNHFVPLILLNKIVSAKSICIKRHFFQTKLQFFPKQPKKKAIKYEAISSLPSSSTVSSLPSSSCTASTSFDVNQCSTKISNSEYSRDDADNKVMFHVFPEGFINGPGKNDVGTYCLQVPSLQDLAILDLFEKVFVPDKKFIFPKNKDNRKFRHIWLSDYSWLAYSKSLDAAFCLQCTLLHHKIASRNKSATVLISKGQNHWSDSRSVFNKHEKSLLHKDTTLVLSSIKSRKSGLKGIDEVLSENYSKRIQENRNFLHSIIDTIILCGRLCISLRGHRDNSDCFPKVGEYAPYSVGNFVDLLNFRIRSGDNALESHLRNCGRNASYVSPQIQNELIDCCGEVISDKIISDIKSAKIFSIICDEACDSSTKEQMSLVFRYVDSDLNLKEDFLRFVHCKEGLSGKALSTVILETLNVLGLDIKDCRGQCYDGAGNVAGKINGCQSHILRENKLALYTHCSSHRLNLVICNSCSVHYVRNMMDQIKQITYFFKYSETRLTVLRKNVSGFCNSPHYAHIIDVCNTRWVERIIRMGVFNDLFEGILLTFEEMAINANGTINSDTVSKAVSHRNALERFEFIVAMVITRKVFDLTMEVTRLLQARTNDIFKASVLIDSLKDQFVHMRENIDIYHSKWFSEAETLANKVSVIVNVPRTVKKQMNRPNYDYSDVSEYYKRAITVPLLDHVIVEFNDRFDHSLVTYQGLVIIPSKMLYLNSLEKSRETSLHWKRQFESFVNFYCGDFPNPSGIPEELDVWLRYWTKIEKKNSESIPDSIQSTLKSFPHSEGVFDNLTAALKLLATIPITSCECERTFSALRRLKNYSRSTMTEDRLNGLALLHIHLGIKIDRSHVIDKFVSKGPRRLDFL